MEGKTPSEAFPPIGTVENPAIFSDGYDLLVCYEIAPSGGGGNAILAFTTVTYFEQNPNNVHEGLRNARYPHRPWDFTEVIGSDRNRSSEWSESRFWTISFNDVMVEIVFSKVSLIHRALDPVLPHIALLNFLGTEHKPADR